MLVIARTYLFRKLSKESTPDAGSQVRTATFLKLLEKVKTVLTEKQVRSVTTFVLVVSEIICFVVLQRLFVSICSFTDLLADMFKYFRIIANQNYT